MRRRERARPAPRPGGRGLPTLDPVVWLAGCTSPAQARGLDSPIEEDRILDSQLEEQLEERRCGRATIRVDHPGTGGLEAGRRKHVELAVTLEVCLQTFERRKRR